MRPAPGSFGLGPPPPLAAACCRSGATRRAPLNSPVTLPRLHCCSLFQQAKERVLLRVKERRAAARVDPRGAFSRTRERWAAARLSLRELKEQQRERLRQYVASAVGASGTLPASSNSSSSSSGSSPLVSSSSLGTRDEAAAALAVAERQQPAAVLGAGGQELDERAAAAAMGSDGVLRVSGDAGSWRQGWTCWWPRAQGACLRASPPAACLPFSPTWPSPPFPLPSPFWRPS